MLALLLAVAMAPPAELKPITSLDAIEIVVHEGEWSISWQDEHVLGQFLVWREDKWLPMHWSACGTGTMQREIGPGTWPTQPMFPMGRARFVPGKYRYQAWLTSTTTKENLAVQRDFTILPSPAESIVALREAIVGRVVQRCELDRTEVGVFAERATTAELAPLVEDARLPVKDRVLLLRRLNDPTLAATLPSLLHHPRVDVALTAALLLNSSTRGVELHVESVIIGAVERGEDVIEALRYGWLPFDERDTNRLLTVLEKATDGHKAELLASVLSAHARKLSPQQSNRGIAALLKVAQTLGDDVMAARLRIDAETWRNGLEVAFDSCCREDEAPAATCAALPLSPAVEALQKSGNVRDDAAP